jgi:hypothetical protein
MDFRGSVPTFLVEKEPRNFESRILVGRGWPPAGAQASGLA